MAFAPVLDRTAYGSAQESTRRASLAAGSALQQIATDTERLVSAVESAAVGDPEQGLLSLRERFVTEINNAQAASRIEADVIGKQLVHQLRQVKAFALLDGGKVDACNVAAAQQLISSGRFELFAG